MFCVETLLQMLVLLSESSGISEGKTEPAVNSLQPAWLDLIAQDYWG